MTGFNVPAAPHEPAPAGLPVRLEHDVRLLDGGRRLLGGRPRRLLTLTDRGARAIADWREPSPVGSDPGRRRLARRLLDADMLQPLPCTARGPWPLTVIVPARDRREQLERCLERIRAACPEAPVIVVDDGSSVPYETSRPGVRVIRHAVARGPAAARNTGMAAARTPFVAFVDSDVVVVADSMTRLLDHLLDPSVAVVAPRVAAAGSRGVVAGYEARHSALDMGSRGGLVAPGRRLPYVPSTVLVARRQALGKGFDESLIIGEDVDLVWRLAASGWHTRYEPAALVWHDHPEDLRRFLARRHLYARSIGMLARRHPRAVPALWVLPALTLPWLLLLSGRPRAAGAAVGWAFLRTERRLGSLPAARGPVAAGLVGRGLMSAGIALARAARRAWAPPLLALAVTRPRVRSALLVAFAVPLVQDAVETRRLCVADVPMRLLDEWVALIGTWHGCAEERTLRPLLPARHRSTVAGR